MDGNSLQNLLGSAALSSRAIQAARFRNKEQASSISVPIPTRELSVLQIQILTLIGIQQDRWGAFPMPSHFSAIYTSLC